MHARFSAVYIDDIAIWSFVEEHEENVSLILEALREVGICASKRKSVLFADEILHFVLAVSNQTRSKSIRSYHPFRFRHKRIQRVSHLRRSIYPWIVRLVHGSTLQSHKTPFAHAVWERWGKISRTSSNGRNFFHTSPKAIRPIFDIPWFRSGDGGKTAITPDTIHVMPKSKTKTNSKATMTTTKTPPPVTSECNFCSKTDQLKKCGRCMLVGYCSRECQQKDWKEHKKICGMKTESVIR